MSVEVWKKPEGLSRTGWVFLSLAVLAVNFPLIHYYVLRSRPEATESVPYQNDFSDPGSVKTDFYSTGGDWRVVNGELLSPGVKNNPLWLKASLPENVAVEFDVRSQSPQGDIKVEIFGDGTDHASGYVLIHGGWNNSLSIIARLDEHGESLARMQAQGVPLTPKSRMRVEANPYRVALGQTYHWRIERQGSLLRWLIDGQVFMQFDDPHPLRGKGHDRFGFSSWESNLYFDNLTVTSL